ncbi:MAG: dephospho-CoA kinase [Athalassotoga sp.]|uniref:dephospho-CoA kinase n=1 Tax=Athalassotoga sp. TaxID=2022597 RepID=UPI003D04230C
MWYNFHVKLIAITGGIATGKSVISRYLRSLGYPVIDADVIGHEVLDREDVKAQIIAHFGDVLDLDGNVDRKKLGLIVFSDKDKLRELNEITHQKITDEILNQAKELAIVNDEIFVEAAVLFEMGLDKCVDFVIVADCPDEMRIQRMILRDHLNYQEALKRIHSQMQREEYLKRADLIVDTSGDINRTFDQIFEMLNKKPWCGKI